MADNDARIEELLARWQAEPGSRVFVQLADEYRKAGKLNEALKVLEAGLKRQPNYLSAKIALGRCRLEKGEAEAATTIFQEVLRRDATNLVANKLLAEAYLDGGLLDKAREQVRLYSILNDRDPEIHQLMRWIDAGGRPKPEPEPEPEPPLEAVEEESPLLEVEPPEVEIEAASPLEVDAGTAEPSPEAELVFEAEVAVEAEPALEGEPFVAPEPVLEAEALPAEVALEPEPAGEAVSVMEAELSSAEPVPDEEIFDLEVEPPVAAQEPALESEAELAATEPAAVAEEDEDLFAVAAAPAGPPAVPSVAEGDVFGDLFGADDQARYLDRLGAEGLFATEVGTLPPPPTQGAASATSPSVAPRGSDILESVAAEGVVESEPVELEPEPVPVGTEAIRPPATDDDIFGGLADSGTTGVAVGDADPVFNLPPVEPGTTTVKATDAAVHPRADAIREAVESPAEPALIEPPVDVAATMVIPQLSRRTSEEAVVSGQAPISGPPEPAEPQEPSEVEEPPATATLGQLYLQQGHRDEARKIFHRVLERDPAHPVALAALQAMDKEDRLESEPETESSPEIVPPETPVPSSEDGWLTAAALLQGSEAAAARGLTARKALVLNNYLARLRAGEQGA